MRDATYRRSGSWRSRTLLADPIDDLIQEANAKLWSSAFTRIRDGRARLYPVVRKLCRTNCAARASCSSNVLADMDALDVDEARDLSAGQRSSAERTARPGVRNTGVTTANVHPLRKTALGGSLLSFVHLH